MTVAPDPLAQAETEFQLMLAEFNESFTRTVGNGLKTIDLRRARNAPEHC